MKHPDYADFDAALLAQIAGGRNTMMSLDSVASGLITRAEPFCTKDRYGNRKPAFRIIDRRLQALRKRGKIRFNGKAWVRLDLSGREI